MCRDSSAAITSNGHGPQVLRRANMFNYMRKHRAIILASASPRRKEILEKTGLGFKVQESWFDEKIDSSLNPRELARSLSRKKAREVARNHHDALVIAADTIVVLGSKLFGKPGSSKEAKEMLRAFSGKTHRVITGFTIIDTAGKKELSRSVESKVFFKRLSQDEIDAYVRSGEPLDKAGGYGIQGLGAALIQKIEGDFYNVMGLPLYALVQSLKKFGIKVLG